MEEQKHRRVALLDQSMGHESTVSACVHGDPSLSSLMTHISTSFYTSVIRIPYILLIFAQISPFSLSWQL